MFTVIQAKQNTDAHIPIDALWKTYPLKMADIF